MSLGARAGVVVVVVLAVMATFDSVARANTVPVLATTRPPWLGDLVHELETAGFDPRVGAQPGNDRWAVRVMSAPSRIDVLSRAPDGGGWIVDERVSLGQTAASRRRAIVRAVEILRARRFSATSAVAQDSVPTPTATPPTPAPPPAPTPPPTTTPPTVASEPSPPPTIIRERERSPALPDAARGTGGDERQRATPRQADLARSPDGAAVLAPSPFSVGIAASAGGAAGGLGAVFGVGLVARWTGHHLSLWSRGEAAVLETTVTEAEGRAAIRSVALSLGAGWSPRDTGIARWNPFLGGEASGLLVRAAGEGGPGYRGQTILVPGLSLGALAGIRVLLTSRVAAVVQGRAGIVAWEPTVTFAGRRVAAWQGPTIATTVDLSWRF